MNSYHDHTNGIHKPSFTGQFPTGSGKKSRMNVMPYVDGEDSTEFLQPLDPLVPPIFLPPLPPPCPSPCPSPCPTCPSPCPNPCPTCPSPCANPCPTLPVFQGIRIENLVPQNATEEVNPLNLGTVQYSSGTGITFTSPDTINLLEPGIYKIFFGIDILINQATDSVLVAVELNNEVVPGSSIDDTANNAGSLVSFHQTTYVSNSTTSTIRLLQDATSDLDSVVTLTITVYKEQ